MECNQGTITTHPEDFKITTTVTTFASTVVQLPVYKTATVTNRYPEQINELAVVASFTFKTVKLGVRLYIQIVRNLIKCMSTLILKYQTTQCCNINCLSC